MQILTTKDKLLWAGSVLLILLVFLLFDRREYLTLTASLLGATSLIFCAKGHPLGQALMIVFSLLYGYISYGFAYYGEMLTYVGMTAPMAVMSLISWLRHPYKGNRSQVQVGRMGRGEVLFMMLFAAGVTAVFFYILKAFDTANLLPSTFSVTTSFLAVYATFRRSPFYALFYAANDVVLMVLWAMAALENAAYIAVLVCFGVFLVNDCYGFYSWKKMEEKQKVDG